jgi:uncharacterized protein
MDILKMLSQEFSMGEKYVKNIVELIDSKNTIPFIARYRKEMTNSCDDQVLRELFDRLTYLRGLEERKAEITNSITEQGKMTDEIMANINAATTLARLEDIYRPFKPKKKTRASIARERGLEPLFSLMLAQEEKSGDILAIAAEFINDGVATAEDALNGAMDILAEEVSDNPAGRDKIRAVFQKTGEIAVTAKDAGKESVYQMYYEYNEPVAKIPSHRVLAINRGEKEDFLKVSVNVFDADCVKVLEDLYLKDASIWTDSVKAAVADGYKRLIYPSLEREIRAALTDNAGEQAIKIFGLNLKALLMQPPIKGKVVLAVDPAYRTGCKIAVCDSTGKVLETTVIYPTPPNNRVDEAKAILKRLIKKHKVEIISIGNGTASKESEMFVAGLISEIDAPLSYMVVSEAGASVYSASKLAAKEFPEFDVSLRSAVSIGRRLQDPLSELVKIDPKAVGVGQYQHDMPEKRLSEALGGVVEDCVNKVGVDLNTASAPLLGYISGLNSGIAQNIVAYREENGAFTARSQLLKVPKLGPKAYTQCAGFLRVPGAKNVLDNTGVHPESYDACQSVLQYFGYTSEDVGNLVELPLKARQVGEAKLAGDCGIGIPTLNDIIKELIKPGRDLRDELPPPLLRTDILDIKDLKPGMEITGTVRNVVDFGAFVDLGVHHDGLIHISQMADKFIKHPSEILKVGQVIKSTVMSVDLAKNRIGLTLRKSEVKRPAE